MAEPVLVGLPPPPHHPEYVGLYRVAPKCMAWLTSHARRLGHIFMEAHAVKTIRQGVKLPLKASLSR